VPERSLCVERGCGCPDEVADGPGRGEGRDEDRMVYPDEESAIESISVPVLKRQSWSVHTRKSIKCAVPEPERSEERLCLWEGNQPFLVWLQKAATNPEFWLGLPSLERPGLTVNIKTVGGNPIFDWNQILGKSEIGKPYFTMYLDNQGASEDISAFRKCRTLACTWPGRNHVKWCYVAKVYPKIKISVIPRIWGGRCWRVLVLIKILQTSPSIKMIKKISPKNWSKHWNNRLSWMF
jgi:hypothetical protein